MASMPGSQAGSLIEDLERAFTWMAAAGVETDPERLSAYRTIAHKWEECADGRGRLGARALQPIVATLVDDATAFGAVHRVFAGWPAEELGTVRERLGDAARGPIRIDDARGSRANPARDALFEAYTTAVLLEAETGPGAAPGTPSRMAITHGRHRVHVECHRFGAGDEIEAGVADACARLVQVFDAMPGARKRGLVALDASRLLAAPPPGHAEDPACMDVLLAAFVERHIARIQRGLAPVDRRIIGVMAYASVLAPARDERDFVHLARWVVIPRHLVNIGEFDLLDRLSEVLDTDRRHV